MRASREASSNSSGLAGPYLIDAKAACELLCMGERRLWVLSNCRAIPSFKIGKSRRYCPQELRSWIRAGCPTRAGAGDQIRKGAEHDHS